VTTAEASDLAFDAALFVRPLFARTAVEGFEEVMAA
jgi:hypothetical protein